MTQLAQLLVLARKQAAEGVRFVGGRPPALLTGNSLRGVKLPAVSAGEVRALARELARAAGGPADSPLAEFRHRVDDTPVSVMFRDSGTEVELTIRLAAEAVSVAVPPPRPEAPVHGPQADPAAGPDPHEGLHGLLDAVLQRGASDLHLRVGEPPLLRIDGRIERLDRWPPLTATQIAAMIARIAPERNWGEYERRNDTDFAYEYGGRARFRVNLFRDRKGPGAVLRAIPGKIPSVDDLEIPDAVRRLCELPKGLILVTGPTGSGKSTTLCALIDLINGTRHDHVITLEDPIEFVHENRGCLITQREIGVHTDSFKSGLRAALREDPDIVLVGELRDLETIALAVETAETGHLVFGTLHTTTAASTVSRIVDQFPAEQQEQIRVMLADSLRGVVSQILLKKKRGGRVAAREILITTPAISNLIREGKTFQIPSVMQTSRQVGMITINDALIGLVERGLVDAVEALAKALDKATFAKMLSERGHAVPAGESGAARPSA